VRTYTRRLPADVAAARQAEIQSDLYEQRNDDAAAGRGDLRHALAVTGRVVRGVPADLSWRHAALRSRPTRRGAFTMQRLTSVAGTAVIVLAAIGIAIAVTVLPVLGSEGPDALPWILPVTLLGAALVAGLVLRTSRPWLATVLLVVGAAAPAVAWFWLPPVYLLSLAIVVAALVDSHGARLQPSHP
jgi:hypothetical protein